MHLNASSLGSKCNSRESGHQKPRESENENNALFRVAFSYVIKLISRFLTIREGEIEREGERAAFNLLLSTAGRVSISNPTDRLGKLTLVNERVSNRANVVVPFRC